MNPALSRSAVRRAVGFLGVLGSPFGGIRLVDLVPGVMAALGSDVG